MLNTRNDISIKTTGMLAITLTSIGLLLLAGCKPSDLTPSSVDAGPTAESKKGRADTSDIAAIIEDREITIADVDEHMKDQFLEEFLQQPEDRQFEMRENAVRDLIQNHIVEAEANKQGKTTEALLEEIENSASEPTIEEITAWYSENQSRLRGAKLEDVASPIKDLMLKERRANALREFLEPKLDAVSWKIVLAPPRQKLETTRLARGPVDAPVTIVTFSDYQCPYCVRAEPILAEILKRYPDEVRLVHRHFPLDSIHPFARRAAEAAMCAEEQGKFWEYHDGIFERQGKLKEDSFAKISSAVGLDTTAFDLCLEERRYQDFVEADLAAGQEAGVTGTPSFFLNGIKLTGARNADELGRHIDRELARIANQ